MRELPAPEAGEPVPPTRDAGVGPGGGPEAVMRDPPGPGGDLETGAGVTGRPRGPGGSP